MKILIFLLQDILLPLWQCLLNFLNDHTFMGVLIGGLIGYFSSNKLINKKIEIESKATLRAILAEIRTLKTIFHSEFTPKINNNEEIYWYKIPLKTDYFPIYHSNTNQIGKIKNTELQQLIIQIYTLMKFFLDCLETNNNILDEYIQNVNCSNISTLDMVLKGDTKTALDILNSQKEQILIKLKKSKNENILPTYNNLFLHLENLDKLTKDIHL